MNQSFNETTSPATSSLAPFSSPSTLRSPSSKTASTTEDNGKTPSSSTEKKQKANNKWHAIFSFGNTPKKSNSKKPSRQENAFISPTTHLRPTFDDNPDTSSSILQEDIYNIPKVPQDHHYVKESGSVASGSTGATPSTTPSTSYASSIDSSAMTRGVGGSTPRRSIFAHRPDTPSQLVTSPPLVVHRHSIDDTIMTEDSEPKEDDLWEGDSVEESEDGRNLSSSFDLEKEKEKVEYVSPPPKAVRDKTEEEKGSSIDEQNDDKEGVVCQQDEDIIQTNTTTKTMKKVRIDDPLSLHPLSPLIELLTMEDNDTHMTKSNESPTPIIITDDNDEKNNNTPRAFMIPTSDEIDESIEQLVTKAYSHVKNAVSSIVQDLLTNLRSFLRNSFSPMIQSCSDECSDENNISTQVVIELRSFMTKSLSSMIQSYDSTEEVSYATNSLSSMIGSYNNHGSSPSPSSKVLISKRSLSTIGKIGLGGFVLRSIHKSHRNDGGDTKRQYIGSMLGGMVVLGAMATWKQAKKKGDGHEKKKVGKKKRKEE